MRSPFSKLMKINPVVAAAGFGALSVANGLARGFRKICFRDKVVVITGGSRGLGLVLARQFAKEKAKIALLARDQMELDKAIGEILVKDLNVEPYVCDVRDQKRVDDVMAAINERFGPVDILINNAGEIEVGPLEEMTVDDFREAIDVHFWGPLYASLAVIPSMRKRRQGRIVNIASIGGKIGVPHLVPYNASKFALVGLSESLRSELMKDNVYVTTVCPGLLRTGSHVQAKFKGQSDLEYTWFSILGALPIISSSAECAAKKILDACRYGDAELIISQPAQFAVHMKAAMPEAVSDLIGTGARLLPSAGGNGKTAKLGSESKTRLSPSVLTYLSDTQVFKNNEGMRGHSNGT